MLTITVTQSNVYQALGTFLNSQLGYTPVQGYDNQVSMLTGDFVNMTIVVSDRLNTTIENYDMVNLNLDLNKSVNLTVQLDFYGPNAGDYAEVFSTTFRSSYGYVNMQTANAAIAPLYTSDPKQISFVGDNEQYKHRFMVEANLQVCSQVVVTQQSFTNVVIGIKEVDATFPH